MYKTKIHVSKTLFSPEVLLKAAYAFIGSVYIHFDEDQDDWIIGMEPKDGDLPKDIVAKFENELLSQAVRLHVFRRTKSIREMLFARALSSTLVMEDDPVAAINEEQDISQEELSGIMRDWFD